MARRHNGEAISGKSRAAEALECSDCSRSNTEGGISSRQLGPSVRTIICSPICAAAATTAPPVQRNEVVDSRYLLRGM